MFQKEALPISFKEGYKLTKYVFRALNNTFVFLMQQQTE